MLLLPPGVVLHRRLKNISQREHRVEALIGFAIVTDRLAVVIGLEEQSCLLDVIVERLKNLADQRRLTFINVQHSVAGFPGVALALPQRLLAASMIVPKGVDQRFQSEFVRDAMPLKDRLGRVAWTINFAIVCGFSHFKSIGKKVNLTSIRPNKFFRGFKSMAEISLPFLRGRGRLIA